MARAPRCRRTEVLNTEDTATLIIIITIVTVIVIVILIIVMLIIIGGFLNAEDHFGIHGMGARAGVTLGTFGWRGVKGLKHSAAMFE